jgi:hypothetical protein
MIDMTFNELLALVIAASGTLLGGIWALFRFYDSRQSGRQLVDHEISLKISELQVKVLSIEKEINSMRTKHDSDCGKLKEDFVDTLHEFKAENKETNSSILTKLDRHGDILTRLDERFGNHIDNHHAIVRRTKNTTA